jgi:Leucine-rich repeat (LRR) protein
MNTIEIYKQEIEAELELAREKLVALKTKIRSLSDTKRLEVMKDVEGLEQISNDMKNKLKELNIEMKDSWEQIKNDIDSSRNKINDTFARLNRSLV